MTSGPKTSILLVEDHEDSLAATAKLLRRSGYEGVTGRNPAQAPGGRAAQRGDLRHCAPGLPDGTGTDLLRELKDAYGVRGIAVTGFGAAGDENILRDAGFHAYLRKPVQFTELLAAVRSACE